MKLKKWLTAGALMMLVSMTGRAWAAVSDALTVTITPNAGYDVDIDTTGVTLNFAGANMDTDYSVTNPAIVSINSTLASTELRLDTTVGGGWSLGSSNATDTLQMWLLFTAMGQASIPAQSGDNFDNTNDRVLGASQQVGDTLRFEDGTTDMDTLASGAQRKMWIRFHTPSQTGDNAQKSVKLTLTAEAP